MMPGQLFDHLLTAIVVVDTQWRILYANAAAEQLMHQSVRRLVNQPLTEQLQHASVDWSHIVSTTQAGQSLTDSDVTWVVDGQPQKVQLSASPLFDDPNGGKILLEVNVVSQQQRISKELAQKAQQQAAKELVRGLAHEIKNPLGGLRGAAQLLEKMLPDASLAEYTQIIIEQADRLRNLVDRLLGPQRPGLRQKQNIHVVLEKVRQLVNLDTQGAVNIIRDYDPSLPDFDMDPEQLEQAILNVVANAADAVREQADGQITLRTRTGFQTVIHGMRHRVVAQIEIIDNGPGISPELQDTLFYPMVTSKVNGNGLGLAITHHLIDQHKGKIEVNSWPGHTCFIIQLPIIEKDTTHE
ncbi:two-component system sensor histidine kinase NtrB [Salinivibrio sp. PR932]|uniref:nitrogen regulation protein NR(II) n=1 Tax=Salinivibrio sp. PR932 TaxID=1909492 RepID=UPI0009890B3F|nr:nitrogen regulation protein NR(II) [Salinivibrio sp. PR932]OOF17012.1 two-component system sensor histidine kinase NtrB [Salinivibrio sp. PR932]